MNKEITELLINVQEKARTLDQELKKARSLLSFIKEWVPKETSSFKMLNEYFNELKTKNK